jgi:transposase
MTRVKKYSLETRERAVRLVFEQEGEHASQWAAISSIAGEDRLYAGDAAGLGATG